MNDRHSPWGFTTRQCTQKWIPSLWTCCMVAMQSGPYFLNRGFNLSNKKISPFINQHRRLWKQNERWNFFIRQIGLSNESADYGYVVIILKTMTFRTHRVLFTYCASSWGLSVAKECVLFCVKSLLLLAYSIHNYTVSLIFLRQHVLRVAHPPETEMYPGSSQLQGYHTFIHDSSPV